MLSFALAGKSRERLVLGFLLRAFAFGFASEHIDHMGITHLVISSTKSMLSVVFVDASGEEVSFVGVAFVALHQDLKAPAFAQGSQCFFRYNGNQCLSRAASFCGDHNACLELGGLEVDLLLDACFALGADQHNFVPAFGELYVHARQSTFPGLAFACANVELRKLSAKSVAAPSFGLPDVADSIADSYPDLDVATGRFDCDFRDVKIAAFVGTVGWIRVLTGALVIFFGIFERDR